MHDDQIVIPGLKFRVMLFFLGLDDLICVLTGVKVIDDFCHVVAVTTSESIDEFDFCFSTVSRIVRVQPDIANVNNPADMSMAYFRFNISSSFK